MSNQILQDLSKRIHEEVHATPDETHGFDEKDVMAAAVLLHAIVMDYGSEYLTRDMSVDDASQLAFIWGHDLHEMVLKMTGVNTYDYYREESHD